MLIDYLPGYLFQNEERDFDWGVMGVSLGGHAVWLCLQRGILTSKNRLMGRRSNQLGMQCYWMSFLHRIDGVQAEKIWITD